MRQSGAALLAACACLLGDPGIQAQSVRPGGDTPLLRTSVSTVLLDVVVRDRAGRPVRDLTLEDFEIREDGRRRRIRLVDYVRALPPDVSGAVPAYAHVQHRARTLAVIVDDLSLGPNDLERVKTTIAGLIRNGGEPCDGSRGCAGDAAGGLWPADRVALVRTSRSERGTLLLASGRDALGVRVEGLRFDPAARVDTARVSPLIDAISAALANLAPIPGRKGLVVFGSGIVVKARPFPGAMRMPDPGLMAALRGVVRQASRAQTVLFMVNVPRFDPWVAVRHDLLDSPYDRAAEGAAYLADETGGLFFKNPADLELSLKRSLADLSDYYVLAYEVHDAPGSAAPGASTPHRLDVRVTRPQLQVRAHRTRARP